MWTINFEQIYTSLKELELEDSGLIKVIEIVTSGEDSLYKNCYV